MKLGLLCVEMVIIVFLGNIGSDYPDDLPSSCPRDKSRLVKTIVDKKILPIFERYRIEMPIECPFHPHRDVLWWPEDNLSAFVFNEPDGQPSPSTVTSITATLASFFTSIWRCPLCSKIFACSETLASHWDAEHRLYRHRTENFVCLSDFCDFMRCDVLSRRRIYPTIGTSKYLARVLSPTLSIDPGYLSPPSSLPTINPENCNKTEMSELEKRCQTVVRQCILPLLIDKITIKDFRDMEEDMVKETCGYLNCEKFWDLTIHMDQTRPLSLCVLIGIIMIIGFLICYYIVWSLFESTMGLKQERLKQFKWRQLKGNRPATLTTPVSKKVATPTATPIELSGSLAKKQLHQGQSMPIRHPGESETSQENSPASNESRYIVTHSGRRHLRPSHLYLASELALLLEKRSMETVPESSDDQGSISLASQSVSSPLPYHHKQSPSFGLTRSNVAIISDRQNSSQASQGSQNSRQSKNSSQSTASPQEAVNNRLHYFPNRRRDFALKGRRNRYDDDYSYDDDTDELVAVTKESRSQSIIKSSSSPPSIKIRARIEGTMSDVETRRPSEYRNMRSPVESYSGQGMKNGTRDCEVNLNKAVRSTSRSLHRVSYSIGHQGLERSYGGERDSSASDTVTSVGPDIESEPVVSVISGRRFNRPGIVRSISSTGKSRRIAMVSQRYSSQPSSSTTADETPISNTNQPRYPLLKSQSNPVVPVRRSKSHLTSLNR